MIEITLSGAKHLARWLDAANARSRRALSVALKVEGFRLMRLLRAEIKKGAPGGRAFTPLSVIAARRRGKYGERSPLRRLATIVRYRALEDEFHIGFVNPGGRGALSNSWLRIARKQQEVFRHGIADDDRRAIIRQLKYLKDERAARFYKLRKATTRFHTPARPIIVPFWRAHQREALAKIRANFRRKIAGERI